MTDYETLEAITTQLKALVGKEVIFDHKLKKVVGTLENYVPIFMPAHGLNEYKVGKYVFNLYDVDTITDDRIWIIEGTEGLNEHAR